LVVVTNSDGQTAQSQVVPVINGEPVPLPPEEGFVIEPDPHNLPVPEVITAMLSADGKAAQVGWSLPNQPFKETNIYLQPPGAAGMTLQAVAGSTVTEYDFPADPAGLWYIYVSYVFLDGREGPLGHVHIVVPDPEVDDAVISSKSLITAANVSLDLKSSSLPNGIFAYVRIGGEANRYERIPVAQGEVLYRQVTGKLFNFQIPFNNWPISQPLMVEVELWALNEDQTPYRVGWYSHNFSTEEMSQGQFEFKSNEFTAHIDLELEEKFGVLVTDTAGGPRPVLLPPPAHAQIAVFTNQCQFVTSTLGPLRDVLYPQCVEAVLGQPQQYLIWDWPSKEPGALRANEDDITGFELKLVVSDAQNQTVGENILPIPFPKARGTLRNTQPVECGMRLTWYLRAVSTDAVSEWVYAGTAAPQVCAADFQGNGCGKKLDFMPEWTGQDLIPDLIFEPACNTHDWCYDFDRSGKSKVVCDNDMYDDMGAICDEYFPLIDPVTCRSTAWAYYEFVNIFGYVSYKGDTDLSDCSYAEDKITCRMAFLSKGPAKEIWEGVKSTYGWSKMVLKTGYEKVVDGVEWGVDKGEDFVNGTVDVFSDFFGIP